MDSLTLLRHALDIPYIVTFVLLSYGLRGLTAWVVCSIFPSVKSNVAMTYGVFVIAIFVGVGFSLLEPETSYVTFLLSYAVGTSMYDLIISAIVERVRTFLGTNKAVDNDITSK